MKTWLYIVTMTLGIGTAACDCNSDESHDDESSNDSSCDATASDNPGFVGTCTEYSGSLWLMNVPTLQTQCSAAGGSWQECPAANRIGYCVNSSGSSSENAIYYYENYVNFLIGDGGIIEDETGEDVDPSDAAAAACSATGGEWFDE